MGCLRNNDPDIKAARRLNDIKAAAISTFNPTLPKGFDSVIFQEHLKDLRTAFALGAQWADNHPYVPFVVKMDDIEDLNIV